VPGAVRLSVSKIVAGGSLVLSALLSAGVAQLPVPAATDPPAGARSASPQDARQVLDAASRIDRRYRSLPPFKVQFTQRYTSATFGAREEARGTVHVVPPSRMLWIYTDPPGQRGALDGNRYWLIDPEEKQVTVRERPRGGSDPLGDLLSGRSELARLFTVSRAKGRAPGGRVLLDLVPREQRDDMERAVLEADEKDGTVRRLEVVDPLGNSFEYLLGPPEPSPAPPARDFELVVPPGYSKVVD
jgi:outer membrane lipoprotein carrier protein